MQGANSGGAASRKRKGADGGSAAPSKVARSKDESPVIDVGCAQSAGECTLSRIDRVVDWHARNDCLSALPTSLSFDTHTLLDSIPFCKLLASILPTVHGLEIPLVTCVYEEHFMRQCIGAHEKPCCMDNQCECMMISKSHPFVGVQFEIPNTEQGSNGMCMLCLRKITTLLFYRTIQEGITVNTQIQRHGNIWNQTDEYHPCVMLICPPNGPVASMPLPIVAHQRNRYEICLVHGVCYLKQVRVGMQDFP